MYGAVAAGFLLTACSAEDVLVDNSTGHVADKTEVRYLRVSICNPGGSTGSRAAGPNLEDDDNAADYVAGTEAENKVKTVDFYFYDDHKNYLSHTNLKAEGENGDDPLKPGAPGLDIDAAEIGDYVDAIYHCNVPVSLVQGERLPAYVLCIINAVNPNAHEEVSMGDAQQQLLYSLYDLDNKKYFGMNNSVYYGTDLVTGQENQLIMATPFDPGLLKTASEVSEAANQKEARLNIYVERYAAKVTLQVDENAVQDITTANGLTLHFNKGNWGLNAYEKSFYLIKGYRMQDDPTKFAPFENVNLILFPGWNRPDAYRSFWARTPAYFQNEYPVVADDILDQLDENTKYDPNFQEGSYIPGYGYSVYYSSFNSAQGTTGKEQYVMETTLKQQRLNGDGMPSQYLPVNSIPSVVLTGKYSVGSYGSKTFYVYGKDKNEKPFVYPANEGEFGDIQSIKRVLVNNQNIILVKNEDNTYRSLNWNDLSADGDMGIFSVDHPSKSVRNGGSLKIAGDIVTLQIKALNGKDLYYFSTNANSTSYVQVTEARFDEVNRLLYQNLGGAHAYVDGMAFFTAPIQHWGWHRSSNKAEAVTDPKTGEQTGWTGGNNGRPMADWDWSQMKAGDFGIVRNHVYTVNVSKIAGLGTGIRNADHPLLPSAEKVGYNVHFDVNIQKWALLPVQNWEW